MATAPTAVETAHEDMIHDCQFDYYGNKLATASSDRTVRIFNVTNKGGKQQCTPVATLSRHEGPVWQVAWAHPKWGTVLASCSYDHRVIIWKEDSPGHWGPVTEFEAHRGSVNSIAWCPHEYGLELACGSSDGFVSILTRKPDDSWERKSVKTGQIGVNAVSWAPAMGSAVNADKRMFVTAGCDNSVKIWSLEGGEWTSTKTLTSGANASLHTDWVRDVAWAPSLGTDVQTIASCGQDKRVVIWTMRGEGEWEGTPLTPAGKDFPDTVWRVSWSLTGNILAVSCGDNNVTLWKEGADGTYHQLSNVTEAGVQPSHS